MKTTFKRIIKLVFSLILFCADKLLCFFPFQRMARCIILYYHAIPETDTGRFARQMDEFLSRVKPLATIEDVPAAAQRRYGMITFDDGFESIVKNALPLLRSRNIPCTIFIPTGSIGGKPKWVKDPAHRFHGEQVVGEKEIARLGADALVTIGSHGVNHSNSRCLPDGEFTRELEQSRRALEKIVGRQVTLFSFPHGEFFPKHLKLAQCAGYTRAFSIEPRFEKPLSAGFLLGRVAVDPADWPIEFFLKLSGAYRWQTWKRAGRKADE